MIKVKDAFRRIGPGSNGSHQLKRKDTPVPVKPSKMLNQRQQQLRKEPAIIDEIEEEEPVIHQSQSSPQMSDLIKRNDMSNDVVTTNNTMNTQRLNRKNSGQRTRSAEDLTTLGTSKKTEPLERNNRSNSHRINRRTSKNANKRKLVAQSYEPNKLLEKAIEEGYSDLVENLITSGQVNINKLNGQGFAPLHLAAFEGKDDIVTILIENGAYIDILTSSGLSALQAAVVEGNFDSAQLLINNGADQCFVLDGPLNPRCSHELTSR